MAKGRDATPQGTTAEGGAIAGANTGTNTDATRAEIRDLVSFRVHAVANLLSRGAALTYRRQFDVSLMEWRTLALLGAHQPLSLKALARHAGLDKSQMSRVVAGLIEREYVARGIDMDDARGIALTLTRAGRRVYEGLIAAANRRNQALNSVLSVAERRQLDDMLARLADKARELIHAERDAVARVRPRTSPKETT